MANARVKTVADAVAARLNAADFSESFSASVALFPKFDRASTGTLDVVVTSGPHTRVRMDRGGTSEIVQNIPVIVRGLLVGTQSENEARIAAILSIVDEIEDELFSTTPQLGSWRAVETIQSVPYDFQKALEDGVFQSILTLRYKGFA